MDEGKTAQERAAGRKKEPVSGKAECGRQQGRHEARVDGHTRVCGLIGNPVEHTLSPLIHNTLAALTGENLCYVPLRVEEGSLEDAVKGAYALNLLGVNVTVPYKSDVMPFLRETDPLAARIGAVNTLVRTEGGFRGYNTDMPGLYRAMCADGVRIEGEKVLILGAGGVARAVAVMLLEKGAERIILMNRTLERAQRVADEVNALAGREIASAMEYGAYESLPAGEKYLAIQATSVGMHPNDGDVVVGEEAFYRKIHTGYDLIFNPAQTRFMQMTQAQGGRAYNGARMLLYQGIIAYELWTGRDVSEEAASQVYAAMQNAMKGKNIILIGFMGSGKTTVGLKLSYRLRMTAEDTDKLIERRQGCSVSEIFDREGEAAFRRMETELLREIRQRGGRRILSVGGGTPVNQMNRELLKSCGRVVYLRVRPETVYGRLKGDGTRPLLQCEDPLARIRELMEARREAYESCADIVIDADDLSVNEIVDRIEQAYKGGRKKE